MNRNKQWLCEDKNCQEPLSGTLNDVNVEFRGINRQSTKVSYLSISATCKKCGRHQTKSGDLYKKLEIVSKIMEENGKGMKMQIALFDNIINGKDTSVLQKELTEHHKKMDEMTASYALEILDDKISTD